MKQSSIIYTNYSSSELKNILLIENFKDVFSNSKRFVGAVTESKISISTVGGSVTYLNGTIELSDKPEFKTKVILNAYTECQSDLVFKIAITFIYSILLAYYAYLIANNYSSFWVYLLILPFSILPYFLLKFFFFIDKFFLITGIDYVVKNQNQIIINQLKSILNS